MGALGNKCLPNQKHPDEDVNVFAVDTIQVDLSKGVDLTWQAARGTTNVSIWTTDDVTVCAKDNGDGNLKVQASIGSKCGAASAAKWYLSLLVICPFLHFLTDNRMRWWLPLMVVILASLFALGHSQSDSDCNSMSSSIHLQIPTSLVKEMCIAGECRVLLCPLIPDSPFSEIPSNNRVLFSDDFCTIKKPEFWDEWLEHYFGSDTDQDYFGDPDQDGLANILEYYGAEAFEGNFVVVDRVNGSATSGGSVRRKRQALRTLVEILASGTDPTSVRLFFSLHFLNTSGSQIHRQTDRQTIKFTDTKSDRKKENSHSVVAPRISNNLLQFKS